LLENISATAKEQLQKQKNKKKEELVNASPQEQVLIVSI
jgi:hypothetical protein